MKLVLCPHVTAHVPNITALNRMSVECAVCGPKGWVKNPGEDDDPFESAGFLEYADHVRQELIPMVEKAAVTMALVPGGNKVDVKMATELGYMVMLDKPIIAIVTPGEKPPAKLLAIADELVEGHIDSPDFRERFNAAMSRVAERIRREEETDEPPTGS